MSVTIRKYTKSDVQSLLALFHDTVHSINRKDYTTEQLNAWMPSAVESMDIWKDRFKKEKTLIAESDGKVVGFGGLQDKQIGMLYVAGDFQGKGAGTALLKTLEKKLRKAGVQTATAEVSITARPFFEKRGYSWVKDNRKMVNGQEFLNFFMEKDLFKRKDHMKDKYAEKKTKIRWSRLLTQKAFDLIIVILGVTIAFQLNNLKTQNDQQTLERFYYESLLSDINEDIKDIEFITGSLRRDSRGAATYLKKMDNPEVKPDSLATVAVNLLTLESFSGNQNTYLTLLNGNGLTAIKNRDIHRQITEYYSHYTYIARFEEIHTDLILEFYGYISPYCDLAKKEITDEAILQSVQTKNYMVTFGKLIDSGVEDYEEMLKKAIALRTDVKLQISEF